MKSKMNNPFSHNFGWKILSLIISISLWFIVTNVNNPVTTKPFTISLTVENKDAIVAKDFIIQNEDSLKLRTVTLKVRGSVKDLADLKDSQKDFKAFIDLKPIDNAATVELSKPITVNVKHSLPSYLNAANFEILEYSPFTVDVILDKYVEKEFSVNVVKNGEGSDQYIALSTEATPKTVLVRGAKTVIDSIDAVRVSVDLKNATKNINTNKNIEVIADNGNNITQFVTLNESIANINVVVNKYAQVKINPPNITGAPLQGYKISASVINPSFVTVVGTEADIAKMKPIELPPISIESARQTVTRSYNLHDFFVNSNLTIKNGTADKVTASVIIAREKTKEIEIPIASIKIDGMSRPFEVSEKSIIVAIRGAESDVDATTIKALAPYVDLAGLKNGNHNLPVIVALPKNIALVGEAPTINVLILETQNFQEPLAPDLDIDSTAPTETTDATESDLPTE